MSEYREKNEPQPTPLVVNLNQTIKFVLTEQAAAWRNEQIQAQHEYRGCRGKRWANVVAGVEMSMQIHSFIYQYQELMAGFDNPLEGGSFEVVPWN